MSELKFPDPRFQHRYRISIARERTTARLRNRSVNFQRLNELRMMLDLDEIIDDTRETRRRLWEVWDKVKSGKSQVTQARMEIAAANAMLSAHKVALTAVHLLEGHQVIPPKKINGHRSLKRQ